MKVFFDTNVYVAEALLGPTAIRLIAATQAAAWRIYSSEQVLDELQRVLGDVRGLSKRLARLSRLRVLARATHVRLQASRHLVAGDPHDSPILQVALQAGVDYLVTNDSVLLALDPYEGLRIISMTEYYELLQNEGLL